MQENRIANYIVLDLEQQHKVPYNYQVSSRIINDVVEGWNKQVYVIPHNAVNLWHKERKKYIIM